MFTVYYKDDFGKKHLTTVKNMAELNFIKERFFEVNYEPIITDLDLNEKSFWFFKKIMI